MALPWENFRCYTSQQVLRWSHAHNYQSTWYCHKIHSDSFNNTTVITLPPNKCWLSFILAMEQPHSSTSRSCAERNRRPLWLNTPFNLPNLRADTDSMTLERCLLVASIGRQPMVSWIRQRESAADMTRIAAQLFLTVWRRCRMYCDARWSFWSIERIRISYFQGSKGCQHCYG